MLQTSVPHFPAGCSVERGGIWSCGISLCSTHNFSVPIHVHPEMHCKGVNPSPDNFQFHYLPKWIVKQVIVISGMLLLFLRDRACQGLEWCALECSFKILVPVSFGRSFTHVKSNRNNFSSLWKEKKGKWILMNYLIFCYGRDAVILLLTLLHGIKEIWWLFYLSVFVPERLFSVIRFDFITWERFYRRADKEKKVLLFHEIHWYSKHGPLMN